MTPYSTTLICQRRKNRKSCPLARGTVSSTSLRVLRKTFGKSDSRQRKRASREVGFLVSPEGLTFSGVILTTSRNNFKQARWNLVQSQDTIILCPRLHQGREESSGAFKEKTTIKRFILPKAKRAGEPKLFELTYLLKIVYEQQTSYCWSCSGRTHWRSVLSSDLRKNVDTGSFHWTSGAAFIHTFIQFVVVDKMYR